MFCLILFAVTSAHPVKFLHEEIEKRHDFINHHQPPRDAETLSGLNFGLFGDWHGEREKLVNKGIVFTGSYGNDLVGNPVGGKHHGFANASSVGLNLRLDFDKMEVVSGLRFFTSGVFRNGSNLAEKKIGNQFSVQQLYGHETYLLDELFFKQSFWNRRLSIKAGRLNQGNDFMQSPIYYQFTNNCFCAHPIAILYDTLFTTYPIASWGVVVDGYPWKNLHLTGGVYQDNLRNIANRYHGVYFSFKKTHGAIIAGELNYQLNHELESTGGPGNYRVGYYYITGSIPKFGGGAANHNYIGYLTMDQKIYTPSGPHRFRGLTQFATFLLAPGDRNEFPLFFSAGFIYDGPLESRLYDTVCLAFAYSRYSKELPQTFEGAIELNYWAAVNNWLYFTPNLQYVINPKGYGTIPNAFVIGLQVSAAL